ncbi:MAG TPA: cyclopropane-fatty-acyl-phospholipid synthase family protein [Nevskiales bacterium]|nr:cyclopropane-fatty-acyl-phospholipid synthase family protein [Nevskiales bacterium]
MSQNEAAQPFTGRESWALRFLRRVLGRWRHGSLSVILPDGQRLEFAGSEPGPHAEFEIRRYAMLRKCILRGDIGFAEAYMEGDWDSPNLALLLEAFVRNESAWGEVGEGGWLLRLVMRGLHRLRRNSRRGSRRNIRYHYDLGNDFYGLWLDETWAYSSAVFERPDQDLAEAQRNKFRLMLERLDLKPGHHLLEIGSGWGGFALYAAQQTGCRVTSITLSQQQLEAARERARQAGLADRVAFRLQDYRDVREVYDRVVSIEMYEAVGEQYWPAYFATLARTLRPGGIAAIQGITIDDDIFEYYRQNVDFIQTYIFPGGMLASARVFLAHARAAGLSVKDTRFFGQHYARTLNEWHRRVWRERETIQAMFDERFLRMWRYYLGYCEAGFKVGRIDLMQVSLHKPA